MYLVYKDNEQLGPLSQAEIQERLECGVFVPTDLYWHEEKNDWVPLSELTAGDNPPAPAGSEPAPVEIPKPYADFLLDKQPESVVQKAYETACTLMGTGEQIKYIAVQKKPFINLHPESAVLTSQRIVLFHSSFFRSTQREFLLREILALNVKKSWFRSAFTFKDATGMSFGIYSLPKTQGQKLFQIAHSLQNDIRAEFVSSHAPVAVAPANRVKPREVDVHQKLGTIKKMLDEGLISPQDYEIKKNELLQQL